MTLLWIKQFQKNWKMWAETNNNFSGSKLHYLFITLQTVDNSEKKNDEEFLKIWNFVSQIEKLTQKSCSPN